VAGANSLVKACFVNAGENLMVCLLLRRERLDPAEWLQVSQESAALLRDLQGLGRGVVFVSAHLGPFELIAPRLAQLNYRPVVVTRESYDARLDPIVDRHRWARRVSVLHRGESWVGAKILRALRGGALVGFLSDLRGSFQSVSVPFLAGELQIPVGPQRLSRLSKAPLVVGTLSRVRGNPYTAHPRFELVLRAIPNEPEVEQAASVARALQEAILRRPEDWLWMA
jgi:KDO2-lipid IV(A) lauroyltransferase